MFISSAYFQKYKRFVDELAEVPMAETAAQTSDQMFEEIRYKSFYTEAYTVKQVYSPPTSLFISAEKFIGKQRNDTFFTWYGLRHNILCANRPLTGVTITFSRSFIHVTGVSTGQGASAQSDQRLCCSLAR